MRISILIISIFFIHKSILGQQTINWCATLPANQVAGSFTINSLNTNTIRGCTPFQVKVNTTTDINVGYIYDYKGGDPFVSSSTYKIDTVKSFAYLKQGTYTILQVGERGADASVACKTIEVYNQISFTAKSCSGKKVQVTIPNDSTTQRFDEFEIDWGNGNKQIVPKSASMVYTSSYPSNANTATISVAGIVGGQKLACSGTGGRSIVLTNTNVSNASIQKLTANNDGSVSILIKGSSGILSEVQVSEGSNGSFKPISSVSPADTLTITIKDMDVSKNTYCFRLNSTDGCDNTAANSNVVCSVNLDVVVENKQNVLNWQSYPNGADFINYSIKKLKPPVNFTNSNRATNSYTDKDVICGNQYCYQIVTQLAGNVQIISPLRCVIAKSDEKPSVLRGTFVNVLDEQKIEIRSDPPAIASSQDKYKAIYYRAPNGSNDFKEIAVKENTLSFIDETANPTKQSYCYKIEYENSCGNRSEPTPVVCSIWLYGKGSSVVEWTPESPFLTDPRVYYLEIIDEKGNPVQQINLGLNTTYTPNVSDQQQFTYRIQSYAQGSPRVSYSNFFVFERNATIYVADAFTPNSSLQGNFADKDDINSTFDIKGSFLKTIKLFVYNRWGQLLFENDAVQKDDTGQIFLKGWDGTVGGQPALEGTYVYRVEFTDTLDKKFHKVGSFLLIR